LILKTFLYFVDNYYEKVYKIVFRIKWQGYSYISRKYFECEIDET